MGVETRDENATINPSARDRLLRRMRNAGRLLGVTAAGATAVLSVAAAHAFRGHDGKTRPARATATAAPATPRRAHVPPPQKVPSIAGAPALQPPAQPPAPTPPASQSAAPAPQPAAPAPQPAPAPETSGGS